MRKNGFSRPWNRFQVSLWIIIAIQIALTEISVIPVLTPSLEIFYAIVYHSSLIFYLVFGFRITFINPTDPLSTLGIKIENKPDVNFCSICNSSAQAQSVHCGKCNKCVSGFDHHCRWVNNCIGKQNYTSFILAICGFAVNSAFVLGMSVVVFIFFYLGRNIGVNVDERINQVQTYKSWLMEVSILMAYGVVSLILTLNLLGFHIWIKCKGITTMQYIINKKKLKSKQVHTASEKENEIEIKCPDGSVSHNTVIV